jgi:hypothetical protein
MPNHLLLQLKDPDTLLLLTKETPLEELLIKKLLSNSHLVESLLLYPLVQVNQVEVMDTSLKERNLNSTKRNLKRKRSEHAFFLV